MQRDNEPGKGQPVRVRQLLALPVVEEADAAAFSDQDVAGVAWKEQSMSRVALSHLA